jgi:peptidoglycan/LPS O-acetylase OafA/YrhL
MKPITLTGKDNNFDFIRFVAALLVIVNHSYYLLPVVEDPLLTFTSDRYNIGKIAVAIFFIISGILITQSFTRAKSLFNYFTSRALRIYPALIFVIFITVFILGPLLTTYSLKEYFTATQTHKYLLFNITMVKAEYFLPGVFESNHKEFVNGSLWTLPNELACYIAVAIIGLCRSMKIRAGMVLLVLFLCVFHYKFLNEQKAAFFLHGLYFASGALAYSLRNKIILNKYAALIAFFVLAINILFNKFLLISVFISAFSMTYVILYLAFANTRLFKNFTKHGDFSYGLYIWGWPVQQIVILKVPNPTVFSFCLISTGITLIMAFISWHFIEKKALVLKKYIYSRNAADNTIYTILQRNLTMLRLKEVLMKPTSIAPKKRFI